MFFLFIRISSFWFIRSLNHLTINLISLHCFDKQENVWRLAIGDYFGFGQIDLDLILDLRRRSDLDRQIGNLDLGDLDLLLGHLNFRCGLTGDFDRH